MFCLSKSANVSSVIVVILYFTASLGGDSVLTLEMVRGMLKSFPPCSLKPHGAGPFKVTVYVLIFCSMSTLPLRNNKLCWLCVGLSSC